jgi:hypothetical protein
VLDRGIPITYFDRLKRSVGINCFPANNTSLEVSGEDILNRIAGYGQIANEVTGDWNTACGTASGIYMGNGLTNSPTGSTVAGWWWVLHIAHNNLYQRQIAYSFLNNSQVFTRIMNNGTWNNWEPAFETYSTSELQTTKSWTNGKPIYRKVLYTNTTTGIPNDLSLDITNLDEITYIDVLCLQKRSAGGYQYKSSYHQDASDNWRWWLNNEVENNSQVVRFAGTLPSVNRKWQVTVEYTKTQS